MAKINGSEGILGIRVASTHNTAVAAGAGHGLCFDSLEYNDNTSILEFSTKGCNMSMKNAVEFGAKAPTLRLTYKLKFGGIGQSLIAGFMGSQSTPSEQNSGQGDYLSYYSYNATRQFYTIALQDSSGTSLEWASCYPVACEIRATVGEPVTVVMDFITSPRNNTPTTNTHASLDSATETTTADYCIYGTDSIVLIDEADGVTWGSELFRNTGFVHTMQRPMESLLEAFNYTNELYYSEPLSSGLFTAQTVIELAGLDDHTWLTMLEATNNWELDIEVKGAQIGTGAKQVFFIQSGNMTFDRDVSMNISSDGFNAATVSFEHLYQPTTQSSGYNHVNFKLSGKDSAAYF